MVKEANILTTEGYFKRFFQHLQGQCSTHKQAYEAVEYDLSKLGAPPKYSDYNSFRRSKNYHLKQKGRLN